LSKEVSCDSGKSFDEFAHHLRTVLIPWPSAGKRSCWKKTEYSFDLARKKPQDIWANSDPEKVREGLRKSAGALKGADYDTFQRDIQN
jgi:hypothetical protein